MTALPHDAIMHILRQLDPMDVLRLEAMPHHVSLRMGRSMSGVPVQCYLRVHAKATVSRCMLGHSTLHIIDASRKSTHISALKMSEVDSVEMEEEHEDDEALVA